VIVECIPALPMLGYLNLSSFLDKRRVQAQSLEIGTGHVTDRESLVFLWQQYPPQVLEGSPQEVQRSPQEAEKG